MRSINASTSETGGVFLVNDNRYLEQCKRVNEHSIFDQFDILCEFSAVSYLNIYNFRHEYYLWVQFDVKNFI